MGCDPRPKPLPQPPINLNPRSPSGLRPKRYKKNASKIGHLNPRSPSGLRLGGFVPPLPFNKDLNPRSPSGLRHISRRWHRRRKYLNPRSPSGLRPQVFFTNRISSFRFKSTQPEWAATSTFTNRDGASVYLNPRSPSGLRRPVNLLRLQA